MSCLQGGLHLLQHGLPHVKVLAFCHFAQAAHTDARLGQHYRAVTLIETTADPAAVDLAAVGRNLTDHVYQMVSRPWHQARD